MGQLLAITEHGRPNKETAIPNERWHWCGILDCTNTVHPDFVFCISCRQVLGMMTVGYCNSLWQRYIDDPMNRKADLFLFEAEVAKANVQMHNKRRAQAQRWWEAQQRERQAAGVTA